MEVANKQSAFRYQYNKSDILQSLFPFSLSVLLYPLKRIQSNHQIQKTYIKQQIKTCKQFFTRCTHHGIRSWFRGLTPYLLRIYIPFVAFNYSEKLIPIIDIDNKFQQPNIVRALQFFALSFSYLLIYPLENARLRMGADVQTDRVYKNARDCLGKMRKVEGKFSGYKGFILSAPYFVLKYSLAPIIYTYLIDHQKQINFPSSMKDLSGITFFIGSILVSQILLHPMDSIRKIVQINGAMNHNNICGRYRDVLKFHKFFDLTRGFGFRVLHSFLYYIILLGRQKKAGIY